MQGAPRGSAKSVEWGFGGRDLVVEAMDVPGLWKMRMRLMARFPRWPCSGGCWWCAAGYGLLIEDDVPDPAYPVYGIPSAHGSRQ